MATAIFAKAGEAIGSHLGGQVGAFIGQVIGATAGSWVDDQIFGRNVVNEGPRLTEDKVTTSIEGAPITRLWGRQRLAGQLIWRTRYRETVTDEEVEGGKGGGSGFTNRTYRYACSFAIGFCEGECSGFGRIWADGMVLDRSSYTIRFYPGSETQEPDAKIVAVEGAAPAFRGLAYLFFEDLPLETFGNRLPQITAEIFKPIQGADPTILENRIQAVTLIPGSGEFALGTEIYTKSVRGAATAENSHNGRGDADLLKSLDALDVSLPNAAAAAIVTSWFGDDLRCGSCTIRPKVETTSAKNVRPRDWRVGGLVRAGAQAVSTVDGRPAYGGTPSDDTVFAAIEELKARGKSVTLYPFILMDIATGNTNPDPYSDGAATTGQPVYPWRGRITCSPAAGYTGTVDKTATAATQVAAFFGTCDAGDFAWNATTRTVDYSGPAEWGLRRMILHYATLCAAAGLDGDDAFLIGSELVGLTRVRSSATAYPAVTELVSLLGEVRTILPAVKLGYAADWSEYHSHRPEDGSDDVFFNLDPLWSDADCDFVGIDNYMPLADWRDGIGHADEDEGGPWDVTYLQANVEGGELYDWYYASDADRDSQTRTAIADTAEGKHWVFRQKDIRNWWGEAHHNRPGGVEDASPTAWTAEAKPVWFTEIGCPAVDKGANQPNVFYDPKSSESALPHYSNGARDDVAQRRFLEAALGYWADNSPPGMIDLTRCFVWAWDARPYPEFPQRSDVWGDTDSWTKGHWLTGRVGVAPLAHVVREHCAEAGLGEDDIDVTSLESASAAVVIGFADPNASSPRDRLNALASAYFFDGFETGGKITFVRRGGAVAHTLDAGDIVVSEDGRAEIELTRGQDIELPRAVVLRYRDEGKDYEVGTATARRQTGAARAEAVTIDSPLVLQPGYADAVAAVKLFEAHIARESGGVAVSPALVRLDPGDVITVPVAGRSFEVRLGGVTTDLAPRLTFAQTDSSLYDLATIGGRAGRGSGIVVYGAPEIRFMDLPMLADDASPHQPYVGAYATPWPGAVDVYRDYGGAFARDLNLPQASILGETVWDFYSGCTGRFDDGNTLRLMAYGSTLSSVTEAQLLAGENAIAIENADGGWEIMQFQAATLAAPNEYVISRLLRGQLGTEGAMRSPVAAGARWCLLDAARLRQLPIAVTDRGVEQTLRYGPGTAFHDAASYNEAELTFSARGLLPWSPTEVSCRQDSAGDWHISWIRRARVGGDDWEAVEVPLTAPDLDAYDIEVLDGPGGNVLRTVSGNAGAMWEYTSAIRTADFGGVVYNAVVRICQLSETVGRGEPWEGYVFPVTFGD